MSERTFGPPPEISVVVPFYNESGAVASLIDEIRASLDGAGRPSFEIVAVDDGSQDATRELLQRAAAADPRVRVLAQPNRGQAAALLSGLRAARAPILATMDGDGQNDPADLPRLLPLLADADMVVGIRTDRADSRLRRSMSRFANRIRGRILGDGVDDSGCALKVFRKEVAESFLPIRTLYSFMPALAVGAGFRVAQTPVRHRARTTGTSNYGLAQFWWKPALDLLGVWWFVRRRAPPAVAIDCSNPTPGEGSDHRDDSNGRGQAANPHAAARGPL
jgi:glycosyltransferase involved in cell wall biosynthesis